MSTKIFQSPCLPYKLDPTFDQVVPLFYVGFVQIIFMPDTIVYHYPNLFHIYFC